MSPGTSDTGSQDPLSSPLMKTAFEIFGHALDHYVSGKREDYRLAVLHLAHSVELAAKAALVNRNVPIFRKDGKTYYPHEAFDCLEEAWGAAPLPHRARVELLIDERNSIQHRYGTLDEVTMDYHMGTAFAFFREVFHRDYQADLDSHIRELLDPNVWSKCKFVRSEQAALLQEAQRKASTHPMAALLEAYDVLERAIRETARKATDEDVSLCTLDVVMKFAAGLVGGGQITHEEVGEIPRIYKMRNAAVYGNEEPSTQEVTGKIELAQKVIRLLNDEETRDILKEAVTASLAGVRGTRRRQAGGPEQTAGEASVR